MLEHLITDHSPVTGQQYNRHTYAHLFNLKYGYINFTNMYLRKGTIGWNDNKIAKFM